MFPQSIHPTTTATVAAGASPDAEFMDHKGIRAHFGLPRSTAYELVAEGKIQSVSLRKKGAIKGKRLFVVQSVRDYLNGLMAEQNAKEKQ